MTHPLTQPPARYFPLRRGRYEVRPGLFRVDTDFGNASADRHLLQLDRDFIANRHAKGLARLERLSKSYPRWHDPAALAGAVNRFLVTTMCHEYPEVFAARDDGHGGIVLACAHTGEEIGFNASGRLRGHRGTPCAAPLPRWTGRARLSTAGRLRRAVPTDR